MFSKNKIALLLIVLFGFSLMLNACSMGDTPAAVPTLPLPDISGYTHHEGEEVLKTSMEADAILGTFFKGNPQFALTAGIIGKMGECAQSQGIARWRLYSDQADLTSSGVILIVSKNRITDPQIVLSCLLQPKPNKLNSLLSPCAQNYSYSANNDTYYVFYAATKGEVCEKFKQALPAAS